MWQSLTRTLGNLVPPRDLRIFAELNLSTIPVHLLQADRDFGPQGKFQVSPKSRHISASNRREINQDAPDNRERERMRRDKRGETE